MFDKFYPHTPQHNRNEEGAVLLLTLITLSVMMAVAFVLTSLVYKDINIARTFADSLEAYYAAESGMERSLDVLQAARIADDSLSTTISNIESLATAASPVTLAQSGARYSIDSTNTTNAVSSVQFPLPLYEQQSVQVELYNPDNSLSPLSAQSAQVLWQESASCPVGASRIEMTLDAFAKAGDERFGLEDASVNKPIATCSSGATGYDCRATTNIPEPQTNYIVRIKSLDCTLYGTTITFYPNNNANGSAVSIPSRAQIAVVGTGTQTQRLMTATTKWVPSALGLSDFVLFSATDIQK